MMRSLAEADKERIGAEGVASSLVLGRSSVIPALCWPSVFRVRGSIDKMRTAQKLRSKAPFAFLLSTIGILACSGTPCRLAVADEIPLETSNSGAQPTSPVVLNANSFKIPFNIHSDGARPAEVHLYGTVATAATLDRDAIPDSSRWKLLDRKPPTITEFEFHTPSDGHYFFSTQTIDSTGTAYPSGPIQPQLEVIVDTTEPTIRLSVDVEGDGLVHGSVKIDDATVVKERHLFYATDVDNQWIELPLEANEFQFAPNDAWRQLSVHVRAVDAAGHYAQKTQRLQRPRLALAPTGTLASAHQSQKNRLGKKSRLIGDKTSDSYDARPVKYRMQLQPETKPSAKIVTSPQLYVRPAPANDASSAVIKLDRVTKPKQPSPTYNAIYLGALKIDKPSSHLSKAQIVDIDPTRLPKVNSNRRSPSRLPITRKDATLENQSAPPERIAQLPTYGRQSTGVELPTPASASEVSEAFSLTPPSLGRSTSPGGAMTMPLPTSSPTSVKSENPYTSGGTASSGSPRSIEQARKKLRPKSAAEAMRPIVNEQPFGVPTQTETHPTRPTYAGNPTYAGKRYVGKSTSPTPEIIPKPPAKRYRSRRSSSGSTTFDDRIPSRFSDSNRFSLEYELESVGRQGVDAVELYGSTDGGASWKFWGQDPDKASPFDIETNEEGSFGFRIVVVSANGLASPRPQANEDPDIVVVVDQSKPQVRITGAQYGEGDRTGSLVIRYDCSDANLMTRPITLSFSDRVDGPWTTIAAGLRNEGDYIWPGDPQLPRQFYIRIDASDNAGNMGSYILDRPIDAQGLAPRARIRGFQSISGVDSISAGEQTATRPTGIFK